jgi:hypothetical protein
MMLTMLLLKNGDSKMVNMEPEMISNLAEAIKETDIANIKLGNGEKLEVTGFVVTGRKTGERVIILPEAPKKDAHNETN